MTKEDGKPTLGDQQAAMGNEAHKKAEEAAPVIIVKEVKSTATQAQPVTNAQALVIAEVTKTSS
jgi:hypothetical protein